MTAKEELEKYTRENITARINKGERAENIAIERYNVMIKCIEENEDYKPNLIGTHADPFCIKYDSNCDVCPLKGCLHNTALDTACTIIDSKTETVKAKILSIVNIIEEIKDKCKMTSTNYETTIRETYNKEKLTERMNNGEDPATLVIEKYDLIKEAVEKKELLTKDCFSVDMCAFCLKYKNFLSGCTICPLYKLDKITCTGTDSQSSWGNMYEDRQNSEAIKIFIDHVDQLRMSEVFKIGKITVTLTPDHDIENYNYVNPVKMKIEGMLSFGSMKNTSKYGETAPYCTLDPDNTMYIVVSKTSSAPITFTSEECLMTFCSRWVNLNYPMSHKCAMEIISWIQKCSDRLHELNEPPLNLGALFGDDKMKFEPVKITITNVLQTDGQKRQKVKVEGLTEAKDRLQEFTNGYPYYRYDDNELYVYKTGTDRIYINVNCDACEAVRTIESAVEYLKLAVIREREIKEKYEKEKKEWDGHVEVIEI